MVPTNPIQARKRDWLRMALEQQGGTITEVAERIGWDRTELSALLNGHRSITDKKMAALSEALGVPLEGDRAPSQGQAVADVRPVSQAPSLSREFMERLEKSMAALLAGQMMMLEKLEKLTGKG